jgi:glucosamine kinase
MNWRIGVDGGATKTEIILVDESGGIAARHLAEGSNPSLVGTDRARRIVSEALQAVRDGAPAAAQAPEVTLLCMAGSRQFWRDFAENLTGFGRVLTFDDSLPVLELATRGGSGLVLHSGTGSFVAARDPRGEIHYAGGLGWRFGDGGSGYDLGRRAIGRALLEMQGWLPSSQLTSALCAHAGLSDWAGIERLYYGDASPHGKIAGFAPEVLRLASEGDPTARGIVLDSAGELLELAKAVANKLFPGISPRSIRAGLSGPVLLHPFVQAALAERSPFPLPPVKDPPVEGVRRMLQRMA